MRYDLFLDDIRTPDMVYGNNDYGFVIVRSYNDFVDYIMENGLPRFISFDNDLGLNKDGSVAKEGYDAAKWLVYETDFDLRAFKFNVHSANPVASDLIICLLNNYIKFQKNDLEIIEDTDDKC